MRKFSPVLPVLPVVGMIAGAALANPAAASDLAWDVIVPTVRAADAFVSSPVGVAISWIGYVGWAAVAVIAVAVPAVRAWDAYAPRVARAIGRHAFRVARAAYRAAR